MIRPDRQREVAVFFSHQEMATAGEFRQRLDLIH